MLIHLLRHAEAEDVSPSGRDEDRRLTDAGLKRMRLVAKAIARLGPKLDAILVSPLVRARQTAEPVAAACGFKGPLTETRALAPSAPPEDVVHELSGGKARSVLLVGHQPHLGLLFGRLVSGREDLELPMKKASYATFETDGDPALDRAELKLYLPPRVLEKLA